jgi:hypothetical protein
LNLINGITNGKFALLWAAQPNTMDFSLLTATILFSYLTRD